MSEVQSAISRNLDVLKAIRGLPRTDKPIAEILGIGISSVNKKMSGDRKWTLEDVEALAKYFRVTPGALIGPVDEVIGASSPNLRATGTTGARPDARRYVPAGVNGIVIPFPQVDAIGPSLGRTALVLPLRRPSHTHASRPSRTVAV